MNHFAKIVCSVTALLSLLSACGAEDGGTPQGAEPQLASPSELVESSDEGVAGEDPNAQDKASGRVYIEFCDRPNNSAGTICRTYDGRLQWPADRDECIRDTRAVCGSARATWLICAGTPCYYM